MSTSYGIGCVTCGRDANGHPVAFGTIDGFRSPEQLAALIQEPGFLAAVGVIARLGLSFLLPERFSDAGDTTWVLKLAADHHALGHEVCVVDEYGVYFRKCWRCVPPCDACGSPHRRCALDAGHAGDCAPEPARAGASSP